MHKCVTCNKTFDTYPIECKDDTCEFVPISRICFAHPDGIGQPVGITQNKPSKLCCFNAQNNPPFSIAIEAVTCPKCLSFIKEKQNGNS